MQRSIGEPSSPWLRGSSRSWGCGSYGTIFRQMKQVCKCSSVSRGQLGMFSCHAAQGGSRPMHHPWVPGLQDTASVKTSTSDWQILRLSLLTAEKQISCSLSPQPYASQNPAEQELLSILPAARYVCAIQRGGSSAAHSGVGNGRMSIPPSSLSCPCTIGLGA